ncbi:hypothetical protein L484_002865 [Morus notabilis]|uniref:Uncharacterized protein n=1 Tax=Morus notabilis TaxID=981085 RepID=W9R4X6_9ROSA|nr:hypothetical protein L484_002865 [Morus notabilis]
MRCLQTTKLETRALPLSLSGVDSTTSKRSQPPFEAKPERVQLPDDESTGKPYEKSTEKRIQAIWIPSFKRNQIRSNYAT